MPAKSLESVARPSAIVRTRALGRASRVDQDVVHVGGVLAPEVGCAWRGRGLVAVSCWAKRDQLLARPEPVDGKAYDVALRCAFFGFRPFGIHASHTLSSPATMTSSGRGSISP